MTGRLVRVTVNGVPRTVKLTTGRPGPGNTGVRGAYAGLTPSGSVGISTPGTVLDGLDITGGVDLRADNVTIRNCRVRAVRDTADSYSLTWATVVATGQPPVGLVLEDVEIDGNGRDGTDTAPYPTGWAQSAAMEPGIGYTMRRCDIHGHVDGLKPQDNPAGSSILIEDTWVHDLVTFYGSAGSITHNDTLHIAGTGAHDVLIRRNVLNGYRPGDPDIEARYASSSLMQWGSYPGSAGVLSNVVIENNWVDGGGYATRLAFSSAATLTGLLIRNNRFGLHHRFGLFDTSGSLAQDGNTAVRSGNVWDVTGITDFGLAVVAGQAV